MGELTAAPKTDAAFISGTYWDCGYWEGEGLEN